MKSPKDMRIIQIDITNACMYRCSNCTRFCGHHKKNFFMDYETFKRAVDSLIGYHGTIGVMGGEPTLHPNFELFVEYLDSKLPKGAKKDHRALVAPQKDFIQSILLENKKNSEVYAYETGDRETVVGAGLWSAMVPSYKKNFELIQDVFKMQAVNDHGNVMYHSPILINRKDLGISDEEWIPIRDHCWAQDVWSATITPKGAFFCEIAGALDMLFDGPGGWPIEEGWWKRTPDQFGEQLKWCEYCGIALETFTRNANDWIDDVSESMYKKLVEIESPKLLKHDAINLVKIKNGVIAEESKKGALEIRKELFYDNFSSRFNQERSILFPEKYELIVEDNSNEIESLMEWIGKYKNIFEKIIVITSKILNNDGILTVNSDNSWGHGFYMAISKCDEHTPIVYINGLYELDSHLLSELKSCVLNPGTLMVNRLDVEVSALLYKNSRSIKSMGMDFITNAENFEAILKKWDSTKIVRFESDVIEDSSTTRIRENKRYVIYGAGETGKVAYRDIIEVHSDVVMFVDSDCKKWGTQLFGITIEQPDSIISKRDEYDLVVIASTYYQDIRKTIIDMGLSEEDFIVHE